jgi:hypothetical protein
VRRLELAIVLTIGCGPDLADDTVASASDSSSPSTSTATDDGMDAGVDDGDEPFPPDLGTDGVRCIPTPQFECTQGVDCNTNACGDAFSPFDESGCPRPSCPCSDDEVCFRPIDWGHEGVSSSLYCAEEGSQCVCTGTHDGFGSYCLPYDHLPVLPCVDFQEQGDCMAANCRWFSGTRLIGPVMNQCTCEPMSGMCVQPVEYEELGEASAYHRLGNPDFAVLLPSSLQPVPTGYGTCSNGDPVPICACAASSQCGQ